MEKIEALVLLSGPIAVGKTSVRQELIASHNFDYVRSSAFLVSLASTEGQDNARTSLQDIGDRLDLKTDYRWVLDNVALPGFAASPEQQRWLVDAVRKTRQIEHFRAAFGSLVLHVHLTAPENILQQRYMTRLTNSPDNTPYAVAVQHANEVASRGLIEVADMVLDASKLTPKDLAQAIEEALL